MQLLENNRAVNCGFLSTSVTVGLASSSKGTSIGRSRESATGALRCRSGGVRNQDTPRPVASYDELLAKPGASGFEVFEDAKKDNPELSDHLKVHKPYIDAVTYQSPADPESRMRRVTEVIDCWYDSGAMPFAQWGYPHLEGSKEKFEDAFPADFISEAIDQTRGWFYTLLAESTLLHESTSIPHPYRTCIVLGHVCDAKGIKMSKSIGNYLDPNEVFDEHGADALRWYFLAQGNSWTNARFSMDRVGESKKDFLIRLFNTWKFFTIYASIDGFDPAARDTASPLAKRSLMDRWITSQLHSATRDARDALDRYDVLGGARALFEFVEHLSTWYVRSSRDRFWATGLEQDKLDAYWTLYDCLVTLAQLSAPFVPFFAERMYRHLVVEAGCDTKQESVHLTDYPEEDPSAIDEALERRMALAIEIVSLGRSARVDAKIRVRQPLSEAVLVLADPAMQKEIEDLLPLVQSELNVETITFTADADRYVEYQFKPNFKLIGPRLGKRVQALKKVLGDADAVALRADLEESGKCSVEVEGGAVELSREELEVQLTPKEGYAARAGRGVVLVLDTAIDDVLRSKWHGRELVAAVNGLRREHDLAYEARIRLDVWSGDDLRASFTEHEEMVKGETLAVEVSYHGADETGGEKECRAGEDSFRVDVTEV